MLFITGCGDGDTTTEIADATTQPTIAETSGEPVDVADVVPSEVSGFPIPSSAVSVGDGSSFGDQSVGYEVPGWSAADLRSWIDTYQSEDFDDWEWCEMAQLMDGIDQYSWTRNERPGSGGFRDAESLVVVVDSINVGFSVSWNEADSPC